MRMQQYTQTASRSEDRSGEKTLLWRCELCGELGSINAVPASCPGCGTGGENIEYVIED